MRADWFTFDQCSQAISQILLCPDLNLSACEKTSNNLLNGNFVLSLLKDVHTTLQSALIVIYLKCRQKNNIWHMKSWWNFSFILTSPQVLLSIHWWSTMNFRAPTNLVTIRVKHAKSHVFMMYHVFLTTKGNKSVLHAKTSKRIKRGVKWFLWNS